LRFALVIIISQTLLIALAVSWFIHMILIEVNGAVYFVERDPAILWAEIMVTVAIVVFASFVLVVQIKRLDERRQNDRVAESTSEKRL